MQIDRRITNGLAWAGVALVIGVPLADYVLAQMSGDAPVAPQQIAVIAPVAPIAPVPAPLSDRPAAPVARPVAAAAPATPKPVPTTPAPAASVAVAPAEPVSVAPAAPVQTVAATPSPASASASDDVVSGYLQSGRPLPSYITGANTGPTVAAAPAVATPAPAVPVAASPAVTAPAAMPVAAAPAVTDPLVTAALSPAKVAPVPMPLSMRPEPVLIVEGPARTRAIGIGSETVSRSSASVTSEDLQDWESGPLSEFLAQRQGGQRVDPDYDPDGFFLDEGPNGGPRGDRLVGPVQQPYFPFVN